MHYIAGENLIYVSIETVAKCSGIALRTLQYRCNKNHYTCRTVQSNKGGGNCGKSYEILVSSIEPEVQEKIFKAHPELLDRTNTTVILNSNHSGSSVIQRGAALSLNDTNTKDFFSLSSGAIHTDKSLGISSNSAPVFLHNLSLNSFGSEGDDIPINQNQTPPSFSLESKISGLADDSEGAHFSINNSDGVITCAPFSLAAKEAQNQVPEKAKRIALAKMDLINHWETYRNNLKNKTRADKDFETMYNTKALSTAIYSVLGKVSVKSLYRWKKELACQNNDYRALIPDYNYSNESEINTKMTEIEQRYFIDLLLHPSKMSIGNAYRLVKYVLERQGVTDICSVKTYRRFAENFKRNHQDIWILMREGQKALSDKVLPYIKRDISKLEVGDVLIADGHTLDFQVINPFTGRPVRATMVAYQDWKSADIAGYDIMLTENTQCIASALRNSIIRLGKYPKIAYQDNGRAFKSKFFRGAKNFEDCGFYGLFGSLGVTPVFAKPYNAKAKPIERFFREFTQTGESLINSYVGNNIVNKPAYMKRNEKFHKEIHDDFVPTIEQAVKLIDSWLEFYRSQPCPHVKDKTIGEVFNEGKGQGIDIEALDDLMMAQEERKIGRNGIKFLGAYYYSDSLYGLNDKVVIKYSLYDLSYVKVYSSKGEYIGRAETVMSVHPMAEYMGDVSDIDSYKRALKTSKNVMTQTMKKAKQTVPKLQKLVEWQDGQSNKTKSESTKSIKKQTKKNKDYTIHYENEPIPLNNNYQRKYDIF